MTFAEKLLELRKKEGLSQEELAQELNVSRQAISRWEMGTAMPDAPNLLQISKLFQVSVDYLLNDEFTTNEELVWIRRTDIEKTPKGQNRTRLIIAGSMMGVGLLGMLILGILGSVIGGTYIEQTESYTRAYTDFLGFLMVYNLGWLFLLCILVTIAGILMLCFHEQVKALWAKMKAKLSEVLERIERMPD